MKRKLSQVGDTQAGLGAPTIMDRALAAEHGSAYVRLVAFAIDLDRAYGHDPDPDARPLGWEVFLTEHYLLDAFAQDEDGATEAERELLEDVCLFVFDQPPEEQALGSQVVFAIYDAMRRGALPDSLRDAFRTWRSPPKQLMSALAELWKDPRAAAAELSRACLAMELDPPLSPPARAALERMASRDPR